MKFGVIGTGMIAAFHVQAIRAMEGAELEFTDAALRRVAQKAIARDTGARALRGVMEEMMLDLMYDLPDMDNTNAEYVIDADHVESGRTLKELRVAKAHTA